MVGSSRETCIQSLLTFTAICTEWLFTQIGSNTQYLTASQTSEAIKTQRTTDDLFGLSSNQWSASSSETLHVSFDFVALPAIHDIHNIHDT